MYVMILVVGPGGVGQTYLLQYLKNEGVKTNHIHDGDGQKHKPHPKYVKGTFKKYIYVYSATGNSVASLYRRFPRAQLNKLGNPYNIKTTSFQNYEKMIQSSKKDLFGIENQFDNFVASTNKDTLFINFYDVPKFFPLIEEFVGQKLDISKLKIKPRSVYKWSDAYSEVYSKLDEKMNAYSGVIIKGKPFK